MNTKIQRLADQLNEEFRPQLARMMLAKFGVEVETTYDFISGRVITTRTDGKDFAPEQYAWLAAWSDGYQQAMSIVRSSP